MSGHGTATIGGVAIASDPAEAITDALPLSLRLIRGDEVETIFFVRVYNRLISAVSPLPVQANAIAGLPISAEADELPGAGAFDIAFLSDGEWCGRPDDFGAAHLEADPRLISAGNFETNVPYLPEQGRRAQSAVASIEAINADGYFDEFQSKRTTDGLIVQAHVGEVNGYARQHILAYEALGRSVTADLDRAVFEIDTVASLLDRSALIEVYDGVGGSSGDANLAGKFVPLCFGECFNISPDLESFGNLVFRVNAGAVLDITTVKDMGAPLIWDGVDHPDYSSLATAAVAPGFFTKSTAIGRFRLGAEPAGLVTADVRGAILFGAYSARTADILAALALGPARLDPSLVNLAAFGALPTSSIGIYLDGSQPVTVADIFDALLAPFNGWYGTQRDRRLTVGVIASPNAIVSSWTIDDPAIYSIDFEEFDEPPRYAQAVTWGRNWSPMAESELVDYTGGAITASEWNRLQRTEETYETIDSSVLIRHRAAFKGAAVRGYFADEAGAISASKNLLAFLKNPMRKARIKTGLNALFIAEGTTGSLVMDRLDLAAGRNATVVRRTLAAERREIEFELLTVMG